MSILAKISDPIEPKNIYSSVASIILASILIVMSLWQLFSLEDFINMMIDYGLPGGLGFATVFGCVMIALEVFSLPYLLRMQLSLAMRFCSMVCGWMVVVVWFFIATLTLIGRDFNNFDNFIVNIWPFIFAVLLCALTIVTDWGMWPIKKRS